MNNLIILVIDQSIIKSKQPLLFGGGVAGAAAAPSFSATKESSKRITTAVIKQLFNNTGDQCIIDPKQCRFTTATTYVTFKFELLHSVKIGELLPSQRSSLGFGFQFFIQVFIPPFCEPFPQVPFEALFLS